MCGIFGGIGNNLNVGIIRSLAIANRERGKQSFGLFDNSGKAIKAGIDPYKALAHAEFSAFINTADRWFLAGHTRKATHGKVSDRNAHPFRFGSIIGAHNGIVDAPYDRNYQVDSEYLFDQLHRCNGNYQTAFADIEGYWGLSWFDGSHFYLQAQDNEVAIGLADDNNYYYSSDSEHLAACIGHADKICLINKGRTIRFADGISNPEMMPDFVTTCTTVFDRDSWRTAASSANAGRAPAGYFGQTSASSPALAASSAGYNARQLPAHYRESKSERKRRKREERRAARDGYGAGTARVSHDEFDLGNVMAQECGYRDLADFMWREECESESAAIRMLRREVAANYGGYDDPSLWTMNDEQSVVVGLDEIPF